MNRLRAALAAILAATLLAPAASASAAPEAKKIGIESNGRTVTLERGQQLHLVLYECDSCGYSWDMQVKPDLRILRRKPTLTQDDCVSLCMGGGVTKTFRYTGRARGTTKLKLAYDPPGDQPVAERFRLTVKVR